MYAMGSLPKNMPHDFKGIGYSKIGYFKEVRSKIKELEKLNIKLARRHNRLEAIFNSMSDGLTILDRNLNIVFANKVQKTMFPGIELMGKKCYTAYHRKKNVCKDCPALATIDQQTTQQGESYVDVYEFAGRYIEWTTSPIINPFGKLDEIILLMRDVTERKKYEYKMMQADRMAAIGFLAAGIAHEINNPLTSIAGFSEGLLKRLKTIEDVLDEQQLKPFREYLEIIQNEAYRCKNIIGNLQEFSRSSSDDFQVLPIARIINDTISLFRQHAKDSRIKVYFKNQLSDGFDTVLGKESQLKHLFLDLFNHSFGSMSEGGTLSIESNNDGNQIEILISDTGEYAQDHSLNIFDSSRMFRFTEEENPIDLSICFSIVQHHKGEINFSRLNRKGGKFRLRFPASLPQPS